MEEEDADGGDVKGQDGEIGLEDGRVHDNDDDDDAGGKDGVLEPEMSRRDEEECTEESTGDGGVVDREGERVEDVFQCINMDYISMVCMKHVLNYNYLFTCMI